MANLVSSINLSSPSHNCSEATTNINYNFSSMNIWVYFIVVKACNTNTNDSTYLVLQVCFNNHAVKFPLQSALQLVDWLYVLRLVFKSEKENFIFPPRIIKVEISWSYRNFFHFFFFSLTKRNREVIANTELVRTLLAGSTIFLV
jgi:hypothetical protein